VAERFRFITGWAPQFREAAERAERGDDHEEASAR
jgi:hypothetical protein